MPTYTFTRTREQLRDMIGRKLGVKEAGQTLPAEESEIILEAIDLRLKELHAAGVLWFNVSGGSTSVTLTAGNASASLSAITDYLFPVTFAYVRGTEEVPLTIIGHAEYQAIREKTQSGEPEVAFFSGSTVRVHPVPSSNTTAKLTYQSIAADTEANTAPDVQASMLRALAVVVAYDLMEDFTVDTKTAQMLSAKYPEAKRTLYELNQERVDATTVAPEWY